MEYRQFGRTGVMVSPLVLGTMNFGDPTGTEESLAMMKRAVEAGINFIDTANIYAKGESEKIVGEGLKKMGNRDRIFLATKFYNAMSDDPNDRGVSRFHIMKECENSLRRLKTDRIDLYQAHRPGFTVPQDETLRALDDLVRQGKVLYIGVTTFPAWKLMEALAVSERLGLHRYVSDQSPYNLLDRRVENESLPLAAAQGLAFIPWSPIAGGALTGKYPVDGSSPKGSRGDTGRQIWKERISPGGRAAGVKIAAYAEGRGWDPAGFALAWVKDRPGVTAPITGPRTMAHLETALTAMGKKLTEEDYAFCDTIVPPGTAVANFFNTSGWMKG